MKHLVTIALGALLLSSCSSFKAQRVDSETADEKGLEITDSWMAKDTEIAIEGILSQIKSHPNFKKIMARYNNEPKVFISEVQNNTSEAYFPVDDFNEELLYKISGWGSFVLVDAKARENLLKEITYQNDGMVDPATAKQIGKQVGADLLIFGAVYMKPEKRSGKTIKEYSVNIRITDLERGIELIRTRAKINKFSDQKAYSW
jgi:uncharacterized protein (TIGR02722 family)